MRKPVAPLYREAMRDLYRRQGLLDGVVALALLCVGWVSSTAADSSDPSFVYTPRDLVFVALLALATLPYAWRSRWPAAAFIVATLSTSAVWWLGYNGSALPITMLLGIYWVASISHTKTLLVCGAVALACLSLLWTADGVPFGATEMTASVVSLTAAVAVGRSGRLRVALADSRVRVAEEAARRRLGEERLRIAGELHDVVGHALGVIAVQAGVGGHLISTNPKQAAVALDNIAELSRSSLDEIRTVVATLHQDAPSYHPTPGLGDLPTLVETIQSTGLVVTLTLPREGTVTVPHQVGAALYRITQEALTNIVRHANASVATVEVVCQDLDIKIAIRDNGTAPDIHTITTPRPTHGISGMHERARTLGGNLTAGPADAGGFLVSGSIPMNGTGRR